MKQKTKQKKTKKLVDIVGPCMYEKMCWDTKSRNVCWNKVSDLKVFF